MSPKIRVQQGFNLVIISTVLLFANANASPKECHLYRETTGERVVTYTWEKDQSSNRTIIVVRTDDDQYFENIYGSDGGTLEWFHRSETRNIRATRKGNEINITGRDRGRTIKKVLMIDNSEWYQAMSYSLRQVASSTEKDSKTFWILRQDNLKAVKLKARKECTETLVINNQKIGVEKVVVTLDNMFLSKLWCGNYWFRKKDHIFLQYIGKNGPPGSPETIIRYISDYMNLTHFFVR